MNNTGVHGDLASLEMFLSCGKIQIHPCNTWFIVWSGPSPSPADRAAHSLKRTIPETVYGNFGTEIYMVEIKLICFKLFLSVRNPQKL